LGTVCLIRSKATPDDADELASAHPHSLAALIIWDFGFRSHTCTSRYVDVVGGYPIALMRPAPMAGRCFNMKMLDGLLECCGQAWTFCLTPA